MKAKALSIIVVNYNTFHLTCTCLRSIFQHSQELDLEVILVDNASSERDPQAFKDLFPEIILIKSPENLGFSRGNNLGLAQARGEFILLLNSDTEIINEVISYCWNRLREDQKIGVISACLIYPDQKIQPAANRFPSILREITELFRITKLMGKRQRAKWMLGYFFDHKSEIEADWVWGTFFMTRRTVIEQFPEQKFPDDYFLYYEDVQWCYLIRKMNFKILYDPSYVLIHHLSASSQGDEWEKSFRKLQLSTRNEADFFRKQKGKAYVFVLFFLRGLKYLTLRQKKFRRIAFFYFRFLWNRGKQ